MLALSPARFSGLSFSSGLGKMPQEDKTASVSNETKETKSIKTTKASNKKPKKKDPADQTSPVVKKKKKKKKKKPKGENGSVRTKKKANRKPKPASRISPTREVVKLKFEKNPKDPADDKEPTTTPKDEDSMSVKGSQARTEVDLYWVEAEKEASGETHDAAVFLAEKEEALTKDQYAGLAVLEAKQEFINIEVEVQDQVDTVERKDDEMDVDSTGEPQVNRSRKEDVSVDKRSRRSPAATRPDFEREQSEAGSDQPIPSASPSTISAKVEGIKAQSILEVKDRPGAFRINGSGSVEDEWRATKSNDGEDMVLTANFTANPDFSDDSLIEERVRQRIQDEKLELQKASVVLIEHGGSSNRYEDPIAEFQRRAELEQYKPQGLKEKMFGDCKSTSSVDIGSAPDDFIRKRDHLPWTVKLNGTTNLWVASVQTNQKAWESSQYMHEKSSLELKRSIQSFAGSTEQEAYELGVAMAPPLMQPLDTYPYCVLCKTKFALLRRPCNCRNCGVVVCTSCSCSWSSKQLPPTYNIEKKSNSAVCLACDWLASSFQEALLNGDWNRAHSLYQTGNVNLRTLYGGKKRNLLGDEAGYPIHMAILGGNLALVKWLIFNHYCPLYQQRSSTSKRREKPSLIVTSKGRTPIDVALEQARPDILKFLVCNQGLTLFDSQISQKESVGSLKHLMCLLEIIPETMLQNVTNDCDHPHQEAVPSVESSSVDDNGVLPALGQFAAF